MPISLFRRDAVLRAIGLLLLASAWSCLYLLSTGAARTGDGGAITYLEAAVGVLGTSFGGVLLGLGRHIYDHVPVAARWAHHLEPEHPALDNASLLAPTLAARAGEEMNARATSTHKPSGV